MVLRFAKVSEEEIEEVFFYPSDQVNTKTTIPLRVGEQRWIHTLTLRVSVYIHHYSPPLRGIVVYYDYQGQVQPHRSKNTQVIETTTRQWKEVSLQRYIANQTIMIKSLNYHDPMFTTYICELSNSIGLDYSIFLPQFLFNLIQA